MESEDYETHRNLTLMFFLEKLLDKGGSQRSLHDLSCQFGTKGFSREMRQIAGGSQAGLRRFFKQYPSLFTVEGDIVSITTHSSSLASGNDSRDYIQEAVQYFETRLEQYGPGTEVSFQFLSYRLLTYLRTLQRSIYSCGTDLVFFVLFRHSF